MSEDFPPSVTATVTCHADGCPVNGVPFVVTLYQNSDGSYRAWCARSNNPITDIVIDT